MRVGSLFSGIGGLDLGLERAGMHVVWQCEADPYCRAVLRKHWPDVPCYEDVRDVTGDAPAVDLICGGFPCQPVSFAGKGLAQADERWLWPEFARIVRELRPRVVLVENVPGLLARGLGDVLGDLAASGYDAEWDCIPAAAVGAPHLRYRVFVVGYPHGLGRMGWRPAAERLPGVGERSRMDAGSAGGAVSDANRWGLEVGSQPDGRTNGSRFRPPLRDDADGLRDAVADADAVGRMEGLQQPAGTRQRQRSGNALGGRSDFPDAEGFGVGTGLCENGSASVGRRRPRDSDSTRHAWATEPDVGRVAHGVPARVDRLRALGNAVVPQVAEWIGEHIMRSFA